MNKDRRKALRAISAKIEDLKEELEAIKGEEEAAKEALPESMQSGAKGEAMDEAILKLEDACNSIDETIVQISDACGEA